MMPLAPTPVIPVSSKPKIGFTIECLVGKSSTTTAAEDDQSSSQGGGSRPSSGSAASGEIRISTTSPLSLIRNCSGSAVDDDDDDDDDKRSRSVSPITSESSLHGHHHHHSLSRLHPHSHHHHHHHHHHQQHLHGHLHRHHSSTTTTNNNRSSSSPTASLARPSSSPPPPTEVTRRCTDSPAPMSPSLSLPHPPSAAVSPPGQFSSGPSPPQTIHIPTASLPHSPFLDTLKGIYAPEPTYTNGLLPAGLLGPHHHHHQPLPCAPIPHIPQHAGFPPGFSPLFLGGHQLHREAYPLYPWLLSRQGRFLGHRFQGPDAPAFLLQPFRKPKRIRTAFSPSQLLKLEHAFEKNHYVVGAERKHLAQTLSLTETQVKVWFQNRRTKHKRIKQEEEQTQNSPPSPKKKGTHHLNKWKMETNQSGEDSSSEAT